mgnify:CR=1 FL=1
MDEITKEVLKEVLKDALVSWGLFISSIFVHELGHVLAAYLLGVKVISIYFGVFFENRFGGFTIIEPTTPLNTILIAFSGGFFQVLYLCLLGRKYGLKELNDVFVIINVIYWIYETLSYVLLLI